MRARLKLPSMVVFGVFISMALFFLWTEQRAHLLGALPYLVFLLCH